MSTIILKKTFKIKPGGFQVATEKAFSFHGTAADDQFIANINAALASNIRYTHGANQIRFTKDDAGHWYAKMNHDCQKYHEEDILCVILDLMAILGYNFRFQWDSESSSVKSVGGSATKRELFMFTRRSDA